MNQILFAIGEGLTITTGAALAIGGGAVTCISGLFALLMKSKEREYERVVKDLEEAKENYEKMAAESLMFASQQANWAMAQQGLPPLVLAPAVVPRSQSPSTPAQRETARLATMVATLAQLKRAMGAEPTPTPPAAPQSGAAQQHEIQVEQMIQPPPMIAGPQPPYGPPKSPVAAIAKDWAESNRVRAAANVELAKAIEAVPGKILEKVTEKIDSVPEETATKVVQKISEQKR